MSGATWAAWDPAGAERRWLFQILLLIGLVGTAWAVIAGNGSLLVAVTPILALGLLAVVWVAPMRMTLFALLFLGLALDTGVVEGPWDSPVAPLGRFLLINLNKTIPVEVLTFPMMAVVLGYLLVIHVHRLLSGSKVDGVSHAGAARPMLWGIGLSLLTVIALIALGVRRGGDIQMAKNQVQNFALLLLMAYLLMVSLRDMRDYRVLGGLILAAAFIKSLMALWVWFTILPTPAYATSHGDSLLFASASTILGARFAERPTRRNAMLCLVMLPFILAGMIVNNRRLVWVEIVTAVLIFFVVSRRTWLKRFAIRAALAALPLILIYVAAGWNSESTFFRPVAMFRSVGDADVDRSTLFRDIENFNLLATMHANPFLGTGFGHPYAEVVKGDDISAFVDYRFHPHNSLLGLWAFGGAFGFIGVSVAVVVGMFLSARSYHWARAPAERVVAFTALAALASYLIMCWGDIGFAEKRSIFLVSAALAAAGRLAVSTGAWDARRAGVVVSKRF